MDPGTYWRIKEDSLEGHILQAVNSLHVVYEGAIVLLLRPFAFFVEDRIYPNDSWLALALSDPSSGYYVPHEKDQERVFVSISERVLEPVEEHAIPRKLRVSPLQLLALQADDPGIDIEHWEGIKHLFDGGEDDPVDITQFLPPGFLKGD